MRKLLENTNSEEIKRIQIIQYIIMSLTFCMFFFVRSKELSFFKVNFYAELIFLFFTFRFYFKAHRNKNYAFWGLTIIIALYLIKNILQFTFVDYNIFVLYLAFLASIFLAINSFLMSSPLYYPRVPWWEYDFRYRGELKGSLKFDNKVYDIRLSDMRRNTVSVQAFEQLSLGAEVKIDVPFGDDIFEINGFIKTAREVIPGRPIRYGIVLTTLNESDKKRNAMLMKMWNLHKKAVIRRKFADFKEESGN